MTAGAEPAGAARWQLDATLRRDWPILALLAMLPAARALDVVALPITIALALAALLAWAATVADPNSPTRALALLSRSEPEEPLGAWHLALFAFASAVCVAYVLAASKVPLIVYNDGAYYYGVARHMAQTGRFEEPILWHFLRYPDAIVHAPFDYWGGATALLLVPSLWLFGDTTRTAFLTMSVVSSAALLAFWYLVCRALPLRYHVTQLLALVLFACSPAMAVYRFQPESIPTVQLFLIVSLIAFCRGHSAVALLCGFGILLSRGDGMILFTLIAAACFVQERRGVDGRPGHVGRLVLVGLACVATYALWSAISFGTLTPPATRLVPFLRTYWSVFDFVTPEQRSLTSLAVRFTPQYVGHQIALAFDALRTIPFAPAMPLWLVLVGAAALDLFRWRRREALVWVLAVGGYFLVAWTSGPGFATVRAPYAFVPLVILAGGLGIDAVLSRLDGWTQRGPSRRRAVLIGAGVLGLCCVFLTPAPPRLSYVGRSSNLPRQRAVAKLQPVLQGKPVASNIPWYMIAYTDSPTITIPFNGPAAVEAALNRYPVDWMVIFPYPNTGGHSRPLLESILAGETTHIGRFQLERVPVAGVPAAAFRVTTALEGAAPSAPGRGG